MRACVYIDIHLYFFLLKIDIHLYLLIQFNVGKLVNIIMIYLEILLYMLIEIYIFTCNADVEAPNAKPPGNSVTLISYSVR